ncbi:chromosome segregation protein SMC [Aliidiomarina halalkaliphila]|uniref:Chromosome partition protein Smc n=1 Tax=Aliidiomarina halalkaliphila TaxID=2593535 RepID=A0A552X4Z7_9GAMM|nr:chromosome segregation protein SMC [Aliidiomarina halalkaliphila]TRW50029.1 chromosome segregation protein SMC [Aliidiomarina halalkaliphila]
MRLQHIKLAGFKSFVDPTKVAFPEQMTCIVGPNGCGKSNVIDAVRWVLGESSAKNLRGDAMTDVIFNGSQSRKPVSQASVELVFDNSSGRVQGEFASFNEISVKRIVTRDAQSTYLLNGTKCRRRDITDLFLGTGLGPRSYAIIEQGMISRLIESRPQELRVFIEEAAGISKYKERRKETESRMNRTRDNLERLADVREELGQQLAKLQRQAAAARRYQTLKAEERTLKSELQALRWNQYQQQCDRLEHQVQQEEAELQKWIAEQRGSERGQTELREREADLKNQVDAIQQRFYQVNNEITKLEQQIQHTRQLAQQRERQGHEYRAQLQQLTAQYDADHEHVQTLAERIADQEFALNELNESLHMAELARDDAELRYQEWQESFQLFRDAQAERNRDLTLLTAEIKANQELKERIARRLEAIAMEIADIPEFDARVLKELAVQVEDQAERVTTRQADLHAGNQALTDLDARLNERQERLQQEHHKAQQAAGRIASLEQLLATTEAPSEDPDDWLSGQSSIGMLRELLDIPERFRAAAQQVLDPWLALPVITESLPQRQFQQGVLVALESADSVGSGHTDQDLRAFADARIHSLSLLQYFAVADDVAAADKALQAHSILLAVLLPDGEVRSRDWVVKRGSHQETALDWQAQLQQQQRLAEEVAKGISTEEQAIAELRTRITQQKEIISQGQDALAEARETHVRLSERLHTSERDQQQHAQRSERLQQEQADLQAQMRTLTEQLSEAQERLQQLSDAQHESAPQLETQQREGEALQGARQSANQQCQLLQQQRHEAQLSLSQQQSKQENLQQMLARIAQQKKDISERLAELESDDEDALEVTMIEEDLAVQLLQRESIESELRDVREQLAVVVTDLGDLNKGQSAVLERIARQQERVQSGKLELAAARERGHALLDALKEMNVSLKSVLETMPEHANEAQWQKQLDDVVRKVSQLGAINLAALEEVEVQAERKSYLDAQHEDLTASLQTLEDAIKKIDRETRQRFKVTYDQVNHDLQQLFPKVFGGGNAYLELTDDDLLETGVTIMARPPGKKNSTIHLLSGGEKALTALALVFAIFRLNPAPFCLLDEVDAPLDDVNVGRFCRLVEEMSETVQFIYISHNKIAMEMATHLSGVTMQEPGVSRLVAVDVDEALALADAPA